MSPPNRHQTDLTNLELEAKKREFGEALKARRVEQGLTQEDLAKKWSYARTTIANFEAGTQVSLKIYQRARNEYADLPTIPGWPNGETNEDGATNGQIDQTEFEDMLLDRTRNSKALLGTWYALWETEIEGKKVFNSEVLEFVPMLRRRVMITNPKASPENPVGGYAWRAECRFFDSDSLLGVYASTEEANISKGALQMKVHVSGKDIDGQWIGESYDGTFSHGHAVFCRDRERLVPRMKSLIGYEVEFEFDEKR